MAHLKLQKITKRWHYSTAHWHRLKDQSAKHAGRTVYAAVENRPSCWKRSQNFSFWGFDSQNLEERRSNLIRHILARNDAPFWALVGIQIVYTRYALCIAVLCIYTSISHRRIFGQICCPQLLIRRRRKTPLARHPFGPFTTIRNNLKHSAK